MTTYIAKYAHNTHDLPGQITLDATTDAEAFAELREFVAAGYRNGTWAVIDMSDGRGYRVDNRRGKAIGSWSDATRGRPPLPDGEGKTERIEWRTTAERKAKAQRLAAQADISVSQWLDGRIDAARG